MIFAKNFDHQVKVAAHNVHPLPVASFWSELAGFQVVLGVSKNPGIIKCAAANTHAGATGFIEHMASGCRCGDIAVANHRNVFHRSHHRANAR
jgi:hypothetical protein